MSVASLWPKDLIIAMRQYVWENLIDIIQFDFAILKLFL